MKRAATALTLFTASMLGCQQPPIRVGELGEPGVDHVPAEVIVKYVDGGSSVAAVTGAVEARPLPLLKNAEVLRFPEGTRVGDVLNRLSGETSVEYAEPNFLYQHANTPSDLNDSLWGLDNRGQTGGVADADIDAVEAWDVTTGSSSVVVAIIDTGVDISHPDLSSNIWRNSRETVNGIDDDGNGYIDDVVGWDFYAGDNNPGDSEGHGTHVAGTIGARGNNGGLVGVAWNVHIMPLRFMGPGGGDTYRAVEAIDYAIANGARVINMSWAGPYYSRALRDAIERAELAGVLVVAAAGNQGLDIDGSPMYPAAYSSANLVSVAATDHRDRLASFSNYGTGNVDIAAPGLDILSTWPGGGYAWQSGTSMAAPYATGVAALALAANPGLSVYELREAVIGGADSTGTLGGLTATAGRLNAARTVALARGTAGNDGGDETPGSEPQWHVFDLAFETAHPYLNATDTTWELSVPGAQYVSLHFDDFHTETGYDVVYVYDGNWNLVTAYDGRHGAFWSEPVPGETVYFRLVSDDSVQRYGFGIDGYASWE